MASLEDFFNSLSLSTINSNGWTMSPWELTLISCVLVSWVALFLAIVSIRRIQKQARSVHHLVTQLNNDLLIASNGAMGMGQRIIKLEHKLAQFTGQPLNEENNINTGKETLKHRVGKAADKELSRDLTVPEQQLSPTPRKQPTAAPSGITRQKISLRVPVGQKKDKQSTTNDPRPSVAVIGNKTTEPTVGPRSGNEKSQPQKLSPFEQAEKLLQQGMPEEEVATRCGLSNSETALMQMVLRQRNKAAV